ncbi:MAG: DUF5333 domain-containing protein [Arenibacterium sp.]
MKKPLTFAVVLFAVFCVSSVTAQSKPALRDVPEVENVLFAVALADAVRDHCASIDARMLKALGLLRRTRSLANEMGYSDAEIRAHVESDVEKARMRAKGEAFLAQRGVRLSESETVCTFGRAEIAKNSAIGALLKAR